MGLLSTGFAAGVGAYRGVLAMAQLRCISTERAEACDEIHSRELRAASMPDAGLYSTTGMTVSGAPVTTHRDLPRLDGRSHAVKVASVASRSATGERDGKHTPAQDSRVGNQAPADYSGVLDPSVVCSQVMAYSARLTATGVTCRTPMGTELVLSAEDACAQLFGSRHVLADPSTYKFMCDVSRRTPAPCNTDQRACGTGLEFCCSRESSVNKVALP